MECRGKVSNGSVLDALNVDKGEGSRPSREGVNEEIGDQESPDSIGEMGDDGGSGTISASCAKQPEVI